MNCEKEKIGEIEGMDEYMNYKKITLNSQFSILHCFPSESQTLYDC